MKRIPPLGPGRPWPRLTLALCLGTALLSGEAGKAIPLGGRSGEAAAAHGEGSPRAGEGSGGFRGRSIALVERSESEMGLYQVLLSGKALGDPLPVYHLRDGRVLLPLGQFAQLLEFTLEVNATLGQASGYLWDSDEIFNLDMRAGRVRLKGRELAIPPGGAEAHEDDIYVDAPLLAAWWPVRLELNQHAQSIRVTPLRDMPSEANAKRLRYGQRLKGPSYPGAPLPRVELPYQALCLDSFDVNLSASKSKGEREPMGLQGGLSGAGDILWMSGYASYQANRNGSHAFQGWLERQDPDGGLLGPLNAKQVAVGDVVSPSVGLISSGGQGPGLVVSNFQPGREIRNDRRTFVGPMPAGWQAELYVNGILLGFQAPRAEGTYEFRDVTMGYGLNVVKVALYGPRGERKENIARVETQNLVASKDEFRYSFFAGRPLGHLNRATLQTVFGLGDDWNLLAGASSLTVNADGSTLDIVGSQRSTRTFATVGLQGQWRGVGLQTSVASDGRGGRAEDGSFRTRLGAWTLGGRQVWLQDYVSEEFQASGQLRSRTALDVSGTIPGSSSPWLGVGANFQRDSLKDGGNLDRGHAYVGTTLGQFSLSNQVDWQRDSRLDSPTPFRGLLLLSRAFQGFSVRGTAGYDAAPIRKLASLGITGDTLRFNPWYLSGSAIYDTANRNWTLLATALKSKGTYAVGISLAHSTVGGWNAAVNLHVGFSRDPLRKRWLLQAQQATFQSLVLARAFVDANGSGRYETGARAIPGASFGMGTAGLGSVSGPDGVGVLANTPGWTDLNLGVTPPDGEDSIYKADVPVRRLLTRPGKTIIVDFPVQLKAEINGTLFGRRGGVNKALGGVFIELVDTSGLVLKKIRSAFDGYFEFKDLNAGRFYQVRLAASEAKRLQLMDSPSRSVKVGPGGGYVDGQDLVVELPPLVVETGPVESGSPAQAHETKAAAAISGAAR